MTWEQSIIRSIVNEQEEEADHRKRIARVMRWQDKKLKQQYILEHQAGYCPNCHTLLPLSGKCDYGYNSQ